MDIKLFTEEVQQLHELIRTRFDDKTNGREAITDGPVNIEKYLNSPIKICWVLKEPYDEVDGKGGGWDFSADLLDSETLYAHFIGPHRSRATWQPIAYATYGILNSFTLWDDMPYLREKPAMTDAIREMAFLNCLKLPARGITKTNMNYVHAQFGLGKDILENQIKLLNPDIIIFGGVFPLFKEMLGIEPNNLRTNDGAYYYIQNDKLYIDAYHPAQYRITRQKYVDGIVSAAKEWYNVVKAPQLA